MSDRPDILIKVGAGFDRSFDQVLASVPAKMEKAFGAGALSRTKGLTAYERQHLAVVKHIYDTDSKLSAQIYKTQAKSELELAKLRMRLDSDRSQSRQREARAQDAHVKAYYKNIVAEHQRAEAGKRAESRRSSMEIAREERSARMAQYKRDREIDRFATRTSHRATRFFFPPPEGALGYMKRTALDVARGAGVDFSLGGGVARAKERETAGMGLAQQERIAMGGQTRGAAYWSQQSLQIGTELGVAPEQVTQMIREFTGKTGDFEGALKSAKELAGITLAAGANMGEMGSAAGFVYNQLKDMPNAGKLTLDVMRGIVGQTAVGAVEMEEYASQMGRIAANAKMFQGDVSKNILELSALTQLSIAEGGATSGADAARSVAAFANTTSKGARINAFKRHGVKLFNKEGTQKRPILDIIKDSLIASKGNIPAMTQMWADTLGQKPIRGLTNAFNEAGGGEAGWKAALAKIEPFMNAQLDPETQRRNQEDYRATLTSRTQTFQNALDRVSSSMSSRLLPTLERLEQPMLRFTEHMGNAVNWAAENPGKAITLAITASIARAGLESLGRLLIDRIMTSFGGTLIGGGAPAGGAPGTALARLAGTGTAGSVAAGVAGVAGVAASAAAAFYVTNATLEIANANMQSEEKSRQTGANSVFEDFASEYRSATTDEGRAKAWQRAQQNLQYAEDSRGFVDRLFGDDQIMTRTLTAMSEIAKHYDKQRDAKETFSEVATATNQSPAYNTEIASVVARELTGMFTNGTLNVKVKNVDDFDFSLKEGEYGPPTAPPSFRQ